MSDPGLAGEKTVVAVVVAEVACCGHAVGHQGHLPLKTLKHITTVKVDTACNNCNFDHEIVSTNTHG